MRVRLPTIFTVQQETNNDDFSTTFTAEEADQQPSCDFYLSAEQAGHRHVRPPDVTDTFCPDRDFEAAAEVVRHDDDHSLQSQNIPQLDGMMYEDPNQPVPPFIRLSRILQNSDQSQTEAEEERRKEHEKDLDNIQRMIQNHVWF